MWRQPRKNGNDGLKHSWTETMPDHRRRPKPTASWTAVAIRDALGWDKPNANGVYHSSMQVAFHWIEEADEEVVYLIPDGITNVTKSERTGCYPDVFARVLAVKEAYYADLELPVRRSHGTMPRQRRTLSINRRRTNWPSLSHGRMPNVRNAPSDRAERYAQLDAARDAEIQLLIAEVEEADDAQVIPAEPPLYP